jgi:zinc transport system substrate-binding protein
MLEINKNKSCTRLGLFVLLGLMLGSLVFAGCFYSNEENSKEPKENVESNFRVVAVSYPLQYLTHRLAGGLVAVDFPVPQDVEDPSQWKPSREAVLAMQSADWVVANGVGASYAKWLPKVSLPESKLCRVATKGLSISDYIAVEDVSLVHSHGPEGEHSHPTMVSRTWLDPAIAKKQAVYISGQLTKIYPQFAVQFSANLAALTKDLDRLTALLQSTDGEQVGPLVTATPLQKFLTRAAGSGDLHLTWFAIPNVEQADLELKALLEDADATGGVVLFDRELPADDILGVLESHGCYPLSLDLIDQPPKEGDFLSSLEANIIALRKALARISER